MFTVQLNCTLSFYFEYTVCCQNLNISCIYNKGCASKQEWPYESFIKMHVYDLTSSTTIHLCCFSIFRDEVVVHSLLKLKMDEGEK